MNRDDRNRIGLLAGLAVLAGVVWGPLKRRFGAPVAAVILLVAVGGGAVVVGSLMSQAATSPIYYVNASGCSDAYTEEQARNSPSSDFCTLEAASAVATSGSTIRVGAGSYGDETISTSKTSRTSIRPARGVDREDVTLTGLHLNGANKWSIDGIEVTGLSDTTIPANTTGRILVDNSDDVQIRGVSVHDTAAGVVNVNGSAGTRVIGSTFDELNCSDYYNACPTDGAGTAIEGTGFAEIESNVITDSEAAAIDADVADVDTSELRNEARDEVSWVATDMNYVSGASWDSRFESATAGQTTVYRVPAGTYAFPSGTATTVGGSPEAGAQVVFKATGGQAVVPAPTKLLLYEVEDVEFDGFKVAYWKIRNLVTDASDVKDDIELRDVEVSLSATGDNTWDLHGGVQDVRIIGGQVGPCLVDDGNGCAPGIQGLDDSAEPADILIDGHHFGPQNFDVPALLQWTDECEAIVGGAARIAAGYNSTCENGHGECLHVFTGDGLTIRNSLFDSCIYFGANFASDNVDDPATPEPNTTDTVTSAANDVLMENNVFTAMPNPSGGGSCCTPSAAIFFTVTLDTTEYPNYTIRHNTGTDLDMQISQGVPVDWSVTNNAFEDLSPSMCSKAGITEAGNKFVTASDVGSTACWTQETDLGVATATGIPARGSSLIDEATGTSPDRDYHGRPRPRGSAADVGAFEYPTR